MIEQRARESEADKASAPTRRVAVVCESTACLPAELASQCGIEVVPIPFVYGDQTYLDGVDITPAAFYERLVAERKPPRTSPPTPGDYLAAWERAAAGGRSVVLVTVSGAVSTLQRSAYLAREQRPDLDVAIVDSRSAGMGQGFVALAAARAAERGCSTVEVVAAAEATARSVRLIVVLDTLAYLAQTAHIPEVAAWIGGLLAIKPVVEVAGGVRLLERVRTRQRSLDRLYEHVAQSLPRTGRIHVAVQHARAAAEAAQLAARLQALLPQAAILTTEFTPVMGGYCGPGLVGAAFYADDDTGATGDQA